MENSEIFCNFVADNQQFNKILLAMISKDKVIEIFFIIDEFCKEFEEELSKQPESSWSKMSLLAKSGITDGKSPKKFATREEVSTMIYNVIKKLNEMLVK